LCCKINKISKKTSPFKIPRVDLGVTIKKYQSALMIFISKVPELLASKGSFLTLTLKPNILRAGASLNFSQLIMHDNGCS